MVWCHSYPNNQKINVHTFQNITIIIILFFLLQNSKFFLWSYSAKTMLKITYDLFKDDSCISILPGSRHLLSYSRLRTIYNSAAVSIYGSVSKSASNCNLIYLYPKKCYRQLNKELHLYNDIGYIVILSFKKTKIN